MQIIIEGNPVPKGRARAYRRGNHIAHYTPDKTAAYDALVAAVARKEMGAGKPQEGALALKVVAYMQIPKSWSKKKRQDAINGKIPHTSKPDLDNIVKSIKDAMNSIVYHDDAQITVIVARKRYGENPCAIVEICDAKLFCG